MISPSSPSGDYYYASGKRIPLTVDEDWVAVDARRSKEAGYAVNLQQGRDDDSRPLRGDLVLVRLGTIPRRQLHPLSQKGAIQPVFKVDGAKLVALPEVRVEESSPGRQEEIHQWLRQHTDAAEIVEDRGDRIVLRPTSGRGRDALLLANDLTEQVGPEMAQPRFLRIVDRFDRKSMT